MPFPSSEYSVVVQGTVAFIPVFITDVYGYSFSLGTVNFGPESFVDFGLSVLLVGATGSRFGAGSLVDRFDHLTVLCWTLIDAVAVLPPDLTRSPKQTSESHSVFSEPQYRAH